MSNPRRSRSSTQWLDTLACALLGAAFCFFSPDNASAQDVEVMVLPLSGNADGDVAPDGSGFVLLASSSQLNRFGVVIFSDEGVSSAEITVGQDGAYSISSQAGDSGYDLETPIALERNGSVLFAFAIRSSGSQTFQAQGAASSSWLDGYAGWFNGTFGSGWSDTAGGFVHYVATTVISDATLADTSDGVLLIGTAGVAVSVVVAGEIILGVGTVGEVFAVAGTAPLAGAGGAAVTVAGTSGTAVATTAEAVTAFGGLRVFGELIGMGVGRVGALARVQSITLAEIQAAGVTLPVARYWLQFYQNAVANGTEGATAPVRVQLFQRIIDLLGG